jgi:hypothetical protein
MFRKLCLFAVLATFCLGYASLDAVAAPPEYIQTPPSVMSGTDEGYVVVRAPVIEHTAQFKNGRKHDIYHAYGIFASDNPDSPFYRATYYSQGSVVTDPVGELGEVAIITIVSPDGSVSWVYLNSLYVDGPIEFYFANGTGRWHGITGGGTFEQPVRRTDGGKMANWKLEWKMDLDNRQVITGSPDWGPPYTNRSIGFTFHGLHLTQEAVDIGNGLVLLENDQSGRVYMDSPDDPFHLTDGYYQGTTVQDVSGEEYPELRADGVWSDVGIKGYTRADGETLWVIHLSWYHEGHGLYWVIGGTGKWRGMRGVGRYQTESLRKRMPRRIDPNNLGSFEFDWKMVE